MRKISILLIFLSIAFFVFAFGCSGKTETTDDTEESSEETSENAAPAEPEEITVGGYAVGETVASKQQSFEMWYLATVDSFTEDEQIVVSFVDGDILTVSVDDLHKVPESPDIAAGDYVLAVWSDTDGKFYGGYVDSVEGNSATIIWDDGSYPSEVDFGKIFTIENNGPNELNGYAVYETVAAKWVSSWYKATIVGIEGQKFNIVYADGDTGLLTVDELHKLDSPAIEVGDSVYALWGSSSFSAGTVQEIQDDGAMIEWDSDFTPSLVEFKYIFVE